MHLMASTRTEFRAQEGAAATVAPPVSRAGGQGMLRRLLDALVSLAAGEWVGSRPAAERHIRVVETMAFGAKKQLVLVSCDGERFLVGVGPDSVQSIVRLRSAAAKEQV